MDKDKKYLSASRIKVLQNCSWKYWCKYELKLPEASNDGSKRGTICHNVFEVLGNPRHKAHYNIIIKKKDAFASKAVKKYVLLQAKKLCVDDEENLQLIKDWIFVGLNYDFFGKKEGRSVKGFSEYDFAIEKDDYPIRYNVIGFIDKLYLYKKKNLAIIRDFKTSKGVFKGGEIDNNLQDWIYSLAVQNDFPEYTKRHNEFLFLKFMTEKDKGVMKMAPIPEHSLGAFEYELSHYQILIENFDMEQAKSNFAADQGFPADGTFSGKLSCGFAKHKGQLKQDGSVMWHCPFKFSFEYYSILDKEDNVIKNVLKSDFDKSLLSDGHDYVKRTYSGCPRHKNG